MTNQNIQTDAATAQPGTTEPPRRVGSPASDELEFRAAGRNYHHANAEVALLSAMLNESRRIRRICRALGTEEFYDWQTREVLHAILFLDNSGREVTPANVARIVKAVTGAFDENGISFVDECAHAAYNPKHIEIYIPRPERGDPCMWRRRHCAQRFSESFCVDLLLQRLPPIKCVRDKWHPSVLKGKKGGHENAYACHDNSR